MEIYDYLVIGLTLFYTASLLHLAGGLTVAIKKDKIYSVHILSIVSAFLFTIIAFWTNWALHDIEWTLPKFFIATFEPASYYFIATILIPDKAQVVESWRDYFYQIKNKYYFVTLLLLINLQVSGYFLFGLNPFSPKQIVALLSIVPLVIALKTKRHIIHLFLMVIFIIQAIAMMFSIASQPGWLLN